MKGQATMEILLLFLVTIAMVALITRPVLEAYSLFSERSFAVMERAQVENGFLAYEIWCNSGYDAPFVDVLSESNTTVQAELTRVILPGQSYDFPGMFEGCGHDKEFT